MSKFSPSRIAIVGGLASGALMAAHLLRGRLRNSAVTIIETRAELGRGLVTNRQSESSQRARGQHERLRRRSRSLRALAVDPARRAGGGRPRIPLRLARSLRPLPRKLDFLEHSPTRRRSFSSRWCGIRPAGWRYRRPASRSRSRRGRRFCGTSRLWPAATRASQTKARYSSAPGRSRSEGTPRARRHF